MEVQERLILRAITNMKDILKYENMENDERQRET